MSDVERLPPECDEEKLEAAYWHFDAERKKTGSERDSFKHAMRGFARAMYRKWLHEINGMPKAEIEEP